MTSVQESSTTEQDPLLISRVEEGLIPSHDPNLIPAEFSQVSHSPQYGTHDSTPSTHDENVTTTDILLSYADNVTEAIAEVVSDVAGEVHHVVKDVAGDLQHTLEELVSPEEKAPDDCETVHLAVARTASFLPGDVARTYAAAEPTFHHPQYQTFEHADTASLSDSQTDIDSFLTRSTSDLDNHKLVGAKCSTLRATTKDQVVVEDPKDLIGISNEMAAKDETKNNTAELESTPLVAYLLLAAAVLGLSSIGPLLSMQSGVDDTVKTLWRNSATAVALFSMALHSIVVDGLPSLSVSQIVVLILTGICYAAYTVLFAWAVEYTTIGNAVMFGNSQAIILLVGKTIMGESLSWAEALGSLAAFGGAILCSRDSAQGDDVISKNTSLLGDGFALLCAVCGLGYLVTAKTIRPVMNLYVFMCSVMFWASVGSLFLAYLAGVYVSMDRHVDHGAFGWLNTQGDRLPLELVMVVSCQFLGALGK